MILLVKKKALKSVYDIVFVYIFIYLFIYLFIYYTQKLKGIAYTIKLSKFECEK
jgi:hypothetical protein